MTCIQCTTVNQRSTMTDVGNAHQRMTTHITEYRATDGNMTQMQTRGRVSQAGRSSQVFQLTKGGARRPCLRQGPVEVVVGQVPAADGHGFRLEDTLGCHAVPACQTITKTSLKSC